jgi:hypothetical protein
LLLKQYLVIQKQYWSCSNIVSKIFGMPIPANQKIHEIDRILRVKLLISFMIMKKFRILNNLIDIYTPEIQTMLPNESMVLLNVG